jgi:hypothetical protein
MLSDKTKRPAGKRFFEETLRQRRARPRGPGLGDGSAVLIIIALYLVHSIIRPFVFHQFGVRSRLRNFPVLDKENPVAKARRGQAVRDKKRGFVSREVVVF